jgi:hypothetical protein
MTPDVTRQSRSRDFTASVICNGAYIHVPSRLDTTVRIYVRIYILDTTVRICVLDTTVCIYNGTYLHTGYNGMVRIYVLDMTVRIYILDRTVRIYDYVLDTMV